ncbi:MAG TPA: hypothetical protein VJ327_08685 [Patescibacteria group bacterium]|nr:hypothetical protein [Patescibacteria group bacterium]
MSTSAIEAKIKSAADVTGWGRKGYQWNPADQEYEAIFPQPSASK